MLNVIVVGMGPIGINAARAVNDDTNMKLVGMVDVDPNKLGKTLDQLDAKSKSAGPSVSKSIREAAGGGANIAIVTTTSKFDRMAPTLRECISNKLHVVSSCEEMSWPRYLHAKLSDEIDAEAKRAGVAMVGTGVNPGFVMDLLPVVLSSMVSYVTGVKVTRKLDASKRRRPLQEKVGATMTPEHFKGLAAKGEIGHQGIRESVAMIAAGLGRVVESGSVKTTLDPVIAEREMPSLLGPIKSGMVRGMRNTARWSGQNLSIELDLTMAVGEPDAQDRVELAGPVPLTLIIPGSTPGDTATVASLINCAKMIGNVTPGLKTMLDMPPVGCRRA
jgi:4-hydroxy-tetrahydrodipicolinate reductase